MEENKLDFKAQSNYIVVTEKITPKMLPKLNITERFQYFLAVHSLLRISRRYTIWQNMVI